MAFRHSMIILQIRLILIMLSPYEVSGIHWIQQRSSSAAAVDISCPIDNTKVLQGIIMKFNMLIVYC